jgi:hypothetical protein
MKFFGTLFLFVLNLNSFGQNSLYLQNVKKSKQHNLILGDRLLIKTHKSEKIKGTLYDWNDSLIFLDTDTILISEIQKLFYTTINQRKISDGLEVSSYVLAGVAVIVTANFIRLNYDSDPFHFFFGTAGIAIVFSVPIFTLVGSSYLIKLKRPFDLTKGKWQLVVE